MINTQELLDKLDETRKKIEHEDFMGFLCFIILISWIGRYGKSEHWKRKYDSHIQKIINLNIEANREIREYAKHWGLVGNPDIYDNYEEEP